VIQNQRTARLRAEMMRLMNLGWDLVGDRGQFEMTMSHPLPPNWWQTLVAVLTLGRALAFVLDTRLVHVVVDEAGVIHRSDVEDRTFLTRNRRYAWDVSDRA
jgi:hypothetical protein